MTIELPKPIAVTPVPNVRYREFTKCGQKPLAGGQIWTYDANSTTPKITYQDPYGMTPNTNPIILDAAGEADVYLNGTYRFVVKDKNGVIQKDVSKIGSWYSGDLDDQMKSVNDLLGSSAQTLMQPLQEAISIAAAAGAGENGWTATLVQDDSGRNQQLLNNLSQKGVVSISALRATTPIYEGHKVNLISANEGQNEGGGTFVATRKASLNDNNGTIISCPIQNVFWVRIDYKEYTPEMFCATPTNAHTSIQNMLDLGFPVSLKDKTYIINYPIVLNTNSNIKGMGNDKSRIRKISKNTVTGFDLARKVEFSVIGDETFKYSIDVDAIFVTAPKDYSANYNYYLNLQDFTCDRLLPDDGSNYQVHHNADFVDTGYGQYGLFFPYLCQAVFKNFRVLNNKYGIYTINTWMNTFERVQWRASHGVIFGGLDGDRNRGGTSTDLKACWVTDVMGGSGVFAWNFYGITYSNMSSCGTDFVGKDGYDPADGVLNFKNCGYTISGFCSEVIYAKKYLLADNSKIFGSSWTTHTWYNRYGGQENYLFSATNESRVTICNSDLRFMYDVNTSSASYYANQPGFAQSTWSSSLDFKHCSVYPKVTGLATGRFSLSSAFDSAISFESKNSKLENVSGVSDADINADKPVYRTNRAVQSSSSIEDFGLVNPEAFKWNTNRLRLGAIHLWYVSSKNRVFFKVGAPPTFETDGSILGADTMGNGATSTRPTDAYIGQNFYDTSINKIIWWAGTRWIDVNGSTV